MRPVLSVLLFRSEPAYTPDPLEAVALDHKTRGLSRQKGLRYIGAVGGLRCTIVELPKVAELGDGLLLAVNAANHEDRAAWRVEDGRTSLLTVDEALHAGFTGLSADRLAKAPK